ncbi:MAG: DNA ligase D, partial [Deltaproteobacteria bacterium]
EGMLKLRILSHRMSGDWALIRMKPRSKADAKRENWLLVKERDSATGEADTLTETALTSVASGRSFDQIKTKASPVLYQTGKRPSFSKPQLATLRDEPPTGDLWRIEPKHDGYRAMIALGKGGARLFTRNGHDWTDRFGALVPYLATLTCDSALLDGEIVAGLGPESFGALQTALKDGGPLIFYAFDLLALNGVNLQKQPLDERRAALERLLKTVPSGSPMRLSPSLDSDGPAVLATICTAGGEGIIAKRGDAPYRGRRTQSWIKVKCGQRSEFIIAGYAPSDKKGRSIASLVMATREGRELVYRGRVGTGFDQATLADIQERLDPLKQNNSPFAETPAEETSKTVWLDPKEVAEVQYAGLTDASRIRHGVFIGLREDKPARTVKLETATKLGVDVAGITITSPKRKVFPDVKITKLGLARYYAEVAPAMLATLADRPLSLLRHPAGLAQSGFFQRHVGEGFPDAIGTIPITESDGQSEDYMYVSSDNGIVACAQMGTIEFHIWGVHRDRIDRPDRMVFDLDPDPTVGFPKVKDAAFALRDLLAEMKLPSHAIVTGGEGIHVAVNLKRTVGWETVKGFAQTFANILAEKDPERFTATMSKAKRKGRIFVDWLRNERGATAIAPFSVRARPGAKVAMPVDWDELATLKSADFCTMAEALQRCKSQPVTSPIVALGRSSVTYLERWATQSVSTT